jgi:antitoxin MazE
VTDRVPSLGIRRPPGNSAGSILPKPVPAELGVKAGDDLSLTLEKGRVVLVRANAHPRGGWAEAAVDLAAHDDDGLVWPEFGNIGDSELNW